VVVKNKAAVCLRLAFHDAATFSLIEKNGGMNASIGYELERPESFGLKRGWRAVLDLEKELKGTAAEGLVSRADLAAFSGAAAVRICGGPDFVSTIPIGRTDATGPDPENRMPAETLSATELKKSFAEKGLSVRELVVLSGAHTIGGKGFGGPESFDNAYYVELMKKPWLNKSDNMASMIGLPSDHVLPEDEECLGIISEFAKNQQGFFREFGPAYVKMTQLGVKWRQI
jgi:L-ascorbate peroxidase